MPSQYLSKKNSPPKRLSPKASRQNENDLELYTKYPPTGRIPVDEIEKLPPAHIPEWDSALSADTWLRLSIKRSEYEKTCNPVMAIEAFLIAHDAGLYPPAWALSWLLDAFRAFHAAQGKTKLDKLLRTTRRPGQDPIFKTIMNDARDSMLCFDIFRLKTLFGVTVAKAAEMVSRKLEDSPNWNTSKYAPKKLSAGTIRDVYLRRWKQRIDSDALRNAIQQLPEADRYKFLQTFPQDAIPANLIKNK